MEKRYLEIESKYNAKEIALTDFIAFCTASFVSSKFVQASGYDHFYSSDKDDTQFGRYRVGPDFVQLTVKTKTQANNNYIRQEDNLEFKEPVSEDRVRSFFAKFGYEYRQTIFKNCFIYKYPTFTMVYYVIYTKDMNEIGRFLEIEMCEDYPWESEEQAWDALLSVEKQCRPLGIIPQARIKKSLYEIVCS